MDLQYPPRTGCQPPDRTGEWQRISKARIIRFGTVRCLRERFAPGGQRSGRGERTADGQNTPEGFSLAEFWTRSGFEKFELEKLPRPHFGASPGVWPSARLESASSSRTNELKPEMVEIICEQWKLTLTFISSEG